MRSFLKTKTHFLGVCLSLIVAASCQTEFEKRQARAEKLLAEILEQSLREAERGNINQQISVAVSYDQADRGSDLPDQERVAEALKWWRKAADQGNERAQVAVGRRYSRGIGVPQDPAEAMKWFRKAAQQGSVSGKQEMEELQLAMYAREAADRGDVRAQYDLGRMYKDGRGVPQDPAEAMKWFRKAAQQGDAQAQYDLGRMYEDGRGVPQDPAEAMKWYRKAAEQGDDSAHRALERLEPKPLKNPYLR